jgi:hypothetical protein
MTTEISEIINDTHLIKDKLIEATSLVAHQVKERNHSKLKYSVEYDIVNIDVAGLKVIGLVYEYSVCPFHPPSDGDVIRIEAELIQFEDNVAIYRISVCS